MTNLEIANKYHRLVVHLMCEAGDSLKAQDAICAVRAHKEDKEFLCEAYSELQERGLSLKELNEKLIGLAFSNRRYHRKSEIITCKTQLSVYVWSVVVDNS